MKINILDLISKKYDELPVNTKVDIENIYRGGEVFSLIEPISIKGRLYRIDHDVIFSGLLETVIRTECNRCLEDVISNISFEFNEKIIGESQDEAYDAIIEMEKDCINLEVFLERLLILKLPMRFLCSDDCKGLCPQCGMNLNSSSCSCEKEDIDIRLIKLKELLKQD